MPWEKSFDTEQALTSAMHAFWAYGYESTSMQDLVDCMGVGRGSLYATFGDKRTLFMQALQLYNQKYRRDRINNLTREMTPRESILAVFESIVSVVLEQRRRDGCFLVNTALEMSAHDPEIEQIVKGAFAEMEAFFVKNLNAAKSEGDISNSLDTDKTAKALLAFVMGLRVFSRARPERDLLLAVVRQVELILAPE